MWNTCESQGVDPLGRILKCTGDVNTITVEEYEDDLHCASSPTRTYTITRESCDNYFPPNNGQLVKRKLSWDDYDVNCPKGTVMGVVQYDDQDSTCTGSRVAYWAESILEPIMNDCSAANITDIEVCDNDLCLQNSPDWDAQYTCENSEVYCDEWSKDMHRCCPDTCETGPLSEEECNALSGKGTCTYPNEAQSCSSTPAAAETEIELVVECAGSSGTVNKYLSLETAEAQCLTESTETYDIESGACVQFQDSDNVQSYRRMYFSCPGNSAFMMTMFWLLFVSFVQY